MMLTPKMLQERTRLFAISIFRLIDSLPRRKSSHIIGNQLGRCASSVAANYRAACRARSHAEFAYKLGIVEEEADESVFWLNMISETTCIESEKIAPLFREANELTAIFTSAHKTAKTNKSK